MVQKSVKSEMIILVRKETRANSMPIWMGGFIFLLSTAIFLLQPTLQGFSTLPFAFLHFIFIILSAGFASYQISKNKPNLILFMLWNFNYCVYGLAAFYQLQSENLPWPVLVDSNYFIEALLATLVMSLIFTTFIELSPIRISRGEKRILSSRRLHFLTIIYPFFLAMVIFKVGGGIKYFFTNRHDLFMASNITLAERGLYLSVCQALTLLIMCLAIREYRFGHRAKFTIWSLFCGSFGMIVICNPLSSARYWVTACIATLVLTNIALTTRRVRIFASLTVVGTLFIFPLGNYFRNSDHTFGFGKSALLSGDYDTLQLTGLGIEWWASNGSVWGHQFLGAILFWVPRTIWATKPIDTGSMVASWAGMGFTNVSGPWVSEALINFGVIGVVVVPIFYYLCLRRLIERITNDDFGIVSYGFLVGYTPILLRGSLIQAMGYLAVFLSLLWFTTKAAPDAQSDSHSSFVRL